MMGLWLYLLQYPVALEGLAGTQRIRREAEVEVVGVAVKVAEITLAGGSNKRENQDGKTWVESTCIFHC